MDHRWPSSSGFPQRTGSENETAYLDDDLWTNNDPSTCSEQLPFDKFIFGTVSNPDASHSMPGSDDQGSELIHHTSSSYKNTTVMIKSSSPPSPLTHPTNPPPPNQHQHSHQQAMPHIWTQRNDLTPSTDLLPHVWEDCHDGVRSFFCAWQGCKHPVGFETKTRLITHIRSVHLHEKPFVCITCQATFTRKQDANRHSVTMTLGKQYKCSFCQKAFSRKHYRDTHEERCLIQQSSNQVPVSV